MKLTILPALKTALAVAILFGVATAFAVLLLGCTKQPSQSKPVGEVKEVSQKNSIVKAHVIRAKAILSVELTPAAKLAIEKLDIALAALVEPVDPVHTKLAESDAAEDLKVALAEAARLAGLEREALSDKAARAARKQAEEEFQRDERERTSKWLLAASGLMGTAAVLSAIARAWIPISSLIWTSGILFAVSALLLLSSRLVSHDWLVHLLAGAFIVAGVCAALVIWRAYLAESPSGHPGKDGKKID